MIGGFIVDFYCDPARLIIEVDGSIHQSQTEYDTNRNETLCSHNLRILRVTNDEVEREIELMLQRIREHLNSVDLTPAAARIPLSAAERGQGERSSANQ